MLMMCVFQLGHGKTFANNNNVGVWFACCTVDRHQCALISYLNKKKQNAFEKHCLQMYVYDVHIVLIIKILKRSKYSEAEI